MSEIKINNTTRFNETRWFGMKLGQTSKVILFFLALLGVIDSATLWLSINSLITYIRVIGFPSEIVSSQIFSIIMGVIILVISCYTLSICVKSKKESSEIQHDMNKTFNTISWFGFTFSQTSAIILFFLAIIWIPPTISSLYFYITLYANYLLSLSFLGGDWINLLGALSIIHYIATLISRLVIYSYSIVRFSQVRKNMDG